VVKFSRQVHLQAGFHCWWWPLSTAGTAIRESMQLSRNMKLVSAGSLYCLDRQDAGARRIVCNSRGRRDFIARFISILTLAMCDLFVAKAANLVACCSIQPTNQWDIYGFSPGYAVDRIMTDIFTNWPSRQRHSSGVPEKACDIFPSANSAHAVATPVYFCYTFNNPHVPEFCRFMHQHLWCPSEVDQPISIFSEKRRNRHVLHIYSKSLI